MVSVKAILYETNYLLPFIFAIGVCNCSKSCKLLINLDHWLVPGVSSKGYLKFASYLLLTNALRGPINMSPSISHKMVTQGKTERRLAIDTGTSIRINVDFVCDADRT